MLALAPMRPRRQRSIIDLLYKKAALSQGEPSDAAVHFDT